MINYLIISKKKWDIENFEILNKSYKFSYKLDKRKIIKYSPKIIFFIHWSEKIPLEIFKRYLCIQFHSSDLPKFKGGSPIQNQIVNGIKKTKITAFKVSDKIDAGDICLKNNLDLNGTAIQIFQKMEKKCVYMIKHLSRKKKIRFYRQKGKSSYFKRRKLKDSNIFSIKKPNISKIFNFIRMLDAPDYPKAYIDLKKYKILLENVKIKKNKILKGEFRIVKK